MGNGERLLRNMQHAARFTFYALCFTFCALLLTACGSRPSGLLRPNGVAIAQDGSLYVMDRGNYRVVHLSASGRFLGAFGRLGSGPNDIYSGWSIALGPAGNIYICNQVSGADGFDRIHDGVKVFTVNGRFLRELGGQDYGYIGQGIPHNTPYGLDIDNQGRVYVADFDASTVRVFDAQGARLARFFGQKGSGDGQFSGLQDVAVDDQRGLMYVLDSFNNHVQRFNLTVTASGGLTVTHNLTFGSYGRAPGQFAYPQDLAVDEASGRVYVSDVANRRIQVFDAQGKYTAEFEAPGEWQVMGLAVGNDGVVYAADALNGIIWAFEPDGRLRSRIEVQP
jgi:tripartite motif-containing protein 71